MSHRCIYLIERIDTIWHGLDTTQVSTSRKKSKGGKQESVRDCYDITVSLALSRAPGPDLMFSKYKLNYWTGHLFVLFMSAYLLLSTVGKSPLQQHFKGGHTSISCNPGKTEEQTSERTDTHTLCSVRTLGSLPLPSLIQTLTPGFLSSRSKAHEAEQKATAISLTSTQRLALVMLPWTHSALSLDDCTHSGSNRESIPLCAGPVCLVVLPPWLAGVHCAHLAWDCDPPKWSLPFLPMMTLAGLVLQARSPFSLFPSS